MKSHRTVAGTRPFLSRFLVVILLVGIARFVSGEPIPGDLFREYTFTNTYGDAGGAIRVGGKKGVSYPDRGSDFGYVNAWIEFPHQLDLEHATRAELIVEKILSHNGTKGLAIQWNDSRWIDLPAPQAIAQPPDQYYHHTSITEPVPLESLHEESQVNRFRLRVNPQQDWDWPQHLVYGVHLRVYYDRNMKDHVAGSISSPPSGAEVGLRAPIAVELSNVIRRVHRVEYLGHYEGVNWEGDGVYRQWHHFYYHGNLIHHLGTTFAEPHSMIWQTDWIPDQEEPISIAARIVDDTNLVYFTPSVDGLKLVRPGLSVELCKPFGVEQNWVTRNGEHRQQVSIKGDLGKATSARLAWSSWSPGYMNGVAINDRKVIDVEGPRYRYFDHWVEIPDLAILRSGPNTIKTGKTPLHNGKMVHGMEVNWPGIQLLIQYRDGEVPAGS